MSAKLDFSALIGQLIKNPKAIQRSVIRSQAKPRCVQYLWPIFEGLGEKNLRFMITNDKPFHKYVPSKWLSPLDSPAAKQYMVLAAALTGDDYIALLPPWVGNIILENEHNKEYLVKELLWLRWRVLGEGSTPWPDLPPAVSTINAPSRVLKRGGFIGVNDTVTIEDRFSSTPPDAEDSLHKVIKTVPLSEPNP